MSANSDETIILLDDVYKTYTDPENPEIRGVSLELKRGDLVVLTGNTGSGKTSLIKLMIGDEKPDSGDVYYMGESVPRMGPERLKEMRRNIGVVFQDYKLIPTKTVWENVAYVLEISGRPAGEVSDFTANVLDIVGLTKYADKFPSQLSGGERQKLAIARAIGLQPDVILADEPTGSLDIDSKNYILDIFRKLNSMGKTILITTHDTVSASTLGGKMVRINNGRIVTQVG